MRTLMINRKTVRYNRERDREGRGQAWICARDFLIASGVPCPKSLVGDFLADHLGAEAVRTAKVNNGGNLHRLIFIHAESAPDLVTLYGKMNTPAKLALKGLASSLEVRFTKPAPVVVEQEPEGEPEVQTHEFCGMELRLAVIDGDPWFIAMDALCLMGYPRKSHSMILKKLGTDEKAKFDLGLPNKALANTISESGLYKLVMRSDKPEAKRFQDWVTRDVLPAIRKDGSYSATDGIEEPSCPIAKAAAQINEYHRSDFDTVAANFKAVLTTRYNERVQKIAELRADLLALEALHENEDKLLALLAA